MKKLVILLIGFVLAYSENMIINSKHFEYNQTSNISIFRDDVNVTKGFDNILTDKLTVYFTKGKKLSKFIADGDVIFKVKDKNATYEGTSKKLSYEATKEIFIFEGDVHIKKLEDNQELFGQKVVINKKDGTANVVGEKNKPLKFIIKVN